MLAPEFSPAKVEQERGRLISEATSLGDQPQQLASTALEQAYFGAAHPYGRNPLGTPSMLGAARAPENPMRGKDCTMSGRLIVTVVGDTSLTADSIFKQVDEFERKKNQISPPCVSAGVSISSSAPVYKAAGASLTKPRVILIDVPDAQQTQVRLMVPGPTDVYSPLYLANVPFGGTFTSRLTRKLRTELGLTYGIYSRLDQRPLASTYEVSSFTKVSSTGEFLKVLFSEIGKARTEGLTAEEIAKGKALMLGEGPMRWERYSGLAALLERNALYGRPDDYPLTSITRAQSLDAKAANAALAAALPNKNYVLVLAGPAAKIKPIAAQYGAVEVWTKQQVIDPK
jgi:predicted Zn-dependent peptidase